MEVTKAFEFAKTAHGDQKYGKEPYSTHLVAVVAILGTLEDPVLPRDFLSTVGYLHDVLEDTDVSMGEIRDEFDEETAFAVWCLTDPDLPTRKERKAALHDRLARMSVERVPERAALIVKAADRLANARSSHELLRSGDEDGKRLLRMYETEHPVFKRAAWRKGLCDKLWEELDSLLDS